MSHRSTSGCPKTSSRRRPDGDALAAPRRSPIPLTISNLKRTLRARNAGGRNAHRHIVSSRPCCRSRLAVIRRDGVPGARSGSDPNPNWTIGNAAAWATSAHHRPSAAAPPPKTLHQVVCRAVLPSVPSGRRGVHAGAFPRRVLNRPWGETHLDRSAPTAVATGHILVVRSVQSREADRLEWRTERRPEATWGLILQHTIHPKILHQIIRSKNVEALTRTYLKIPDYCRSAINEE
jgi:hypothetical protein